MKYQKRFKILLSVAMATSSICVPITTIYAADETIALRETTPNVEASSESVPLMDPSHQLCEEIESLFIQSIDSIDYKIKLKSAEAKIKLLNNEEAQAFYQKEVMNIRAYREVVNEYTTLLEEATGDVELLYNGGRLDQIQEKMEAVHGMLQEGSPLNEMLKEKVKEIQDIKILCRNIRQALGALQIKDLDNENEITKTGHPFIEILETDKSDIYEAIRELERKNDNLRKVVDGFRTELQNIQIVKFKAERDALNDQKDRAKKCIDANRECKVASLDALKEALDFANNAPNQDQRSVLIYHTENLEKWYQKASIECKTEKILVQNEVMSLESLNKLAQGLRESIENKDLSQERLKYFTAKLEALIYDAEKEIYEVAKKQPKDETKKEEQPKAEVQVEVAPAVAKEKSKAKEVVAAKEKPKAEVAPAVAKEKPKAEVAPAVAKEKPKAEVPPAVAKEESKAKVAPAVAKEESKAKVAPAAVKEKPANVSGGGSGSPQRQKAEKIESVSTSIEMKDVIAENEMDQVMSNLRDVAQDQVHYSAIKKVITKGLMQGYADHSFKPAKEITRAEAAQVLAKLIIEPVQESVKDLKDITPDKWFYNAVQKCIDARIMVGYEDNSFRPNGTITKAEILVAISNLQKIEPLQTEAADKVLAKYKDNASIPNWAKGYIAALIDKGMIQEVNDTLNVTAPLTREQMAGVLSQIIK